MTNCLLLSQWFALRLRRSERGEESRERTLSYPTPDSDLFKRWEVYSSNGERGYETLGHRASSYSLHWPISSSTNAVSFSAARTTNRFPSPRCASAIQIVRPLESIAETQPQLQPAFLRLSAMISQYFTTLTHAIRAISVCCLFSALR